MTDMQNQVLRIKQQRIILRAQYCKLRDLYIGEDKSYNGDLRLYEALCRGLCK